MNRIITATVAVVGLCALAFFVFRHENLSKIERLERELAQLETENRELEDQNTKLATRVHALRDDPRLAERKAREIGALARPNELIFQFKSDAAQTPIEVRLTVQDQTCTLAGETLPCNELELELQNLMSNVPNAQIRLDFKTETGALEKQRVLDILQKAKVPYKDTSAPS